MSDYPQFTFDKSRIPDMSSELCEEFREYARRQIVYLIPDCDSLNPAMSFEKFKEYILKTRGAMLVDEPTQVRQRLKVCLNPSGESVWAKEFEKWLKDNGEEV